MQLHEMTSGDISSLYEVIGDFGKGTKTSIYNDLAISDYYQNTNFYEDTEFVVFDTETLGFNDDIIEIGAIIVKNNKILSDDGNFYDYSYYMDNNGRNLVSMKKFAYFVKPTVDEVPQHITEVTSIDMNMILAGLETGETFPNFTEALIAFMEFCGGRPLIAHNARFDTRIFQWSIWHHSSDINRAIQEGRTTLDEISSFFSLSTIDTLSDAKSLLKLNPKSNHKNNSMSELFGLVPNENMLHRAYYDVIFTARVFYGLYELALNTLNTVAHNTIGFDRVSYVMIEKETQAFGEISITTSSSITNTLDYLLGNFIHRHGLDLNSIDMIYRVFYRHEDGQYVEYSKEAIDFSIIEKHYNMLLEKIKNDEAHFARQQKRAIM